MVPQKLTDKKPNAGHSRLLGISLLVLIWLLAACTPPSAMPVVNFPTGSVSNEWLPTPTAQPVIVPPKINQNNQGKIPDYFQSIPLDGIYPVYAPKFVNGVDAPLDDRELVIGVAIEGEAKAYPITVLRFREMVNDELAGLPILVTW